MKSPLKLASVQNKDLKY